MDSVHSRRKTVGPRRLDAMLTTGRASDDPTGAIRVTSYFPFRLSLALRRYLPQCTRSCFGSFALAKNSRKLGLLMNVNSLQRKDKVINRWYIFFSQLHNVKSLKRKTDASRSCRGPDCRCDPKRVCSEIFVQLADMLCGLPRDRRSAWRFDNRVGRRRFRQ